MDVFTRNVAIQSAGKGIRVVSVCPVLMATPRITSRMKAKFGDNFEVVLNERNKIVPTCFMGEAWDVAFAVAVIASDDAKYITAIKLVDGSLSASALGFSNADNEKNL